jgi:hypothetical protein
MRSRLFICAALAGTCLFGTWSQTARAADPKAKSKKAKSGDSLSDDKVISKQMQWEDSVMGPDDKRAELDKIARAQAINKAAAEKAAKEKEKSDAQAAKEAAAPKPQTTKRGGEVALPTLPDEDSTKGSKGKSSEISSKLETAAAAAPPPPVKHGDDKFIDKLLNDPSAKKHKASAADDKALDDLLAVEKPAAPVKGRGKRDDVDSILSAKPQPVQETHVKHETPEWAKPEISSAPVEAPMPMRPQPKRDDGVIHVVQGAAPIGRPVPAVRHTVAAPPPTRASIATRTAAGHRQASPTQDNSWNDPFASGPKKTVAARETHSDSGADDLDGDVAVTRRRATPSQTTRNGRGSRDADDDLGAKTTGGTRRAAPSAKPPKWKDPFTASDTPAPARSTLATREPHKGESSKWDVAERHAAPAATAETPHDRSGRWGVLKKHAH